MKDQKTRRNCRKVLTEEQRFALALLPPIYREVVQRSDEQQQPYYTIALQLGCSLNTVKSLVRRGRLLLERYSQGLQGWGGAGGA